MVKKEEISDIISDEAYADHKFKKGLVLKFEYEGSMTTLRLTRVDRKNKRTWGEHITLVNMDKGMSHYGHNIDTSPNLPFCIDCNIPVSEFATQKGDKRAWDRDNKKMRKLTGRSER